MASENRRPHAAADLYRPGGAAVSQPGPAWKARSRGDQADGHPARPVARLLAGRRRAGAGHRRGREPRLRLHDQGQFRRGDHQRHRHSRPRQSRRAGGKAGDGGQGRPLQAFRRHRLDRSRSLLRGSRRNHQLRETARQELGRHQSRGHQGAGMLHHRAEAARAARYSGLPRRPARHLDHRRRRPDQRARTHRPRDQEDQARLQRRRRRRHRLPRTSPRHRLSPGKPHPLRHQGRDLPGPHRGHEPVEIGLCDQDFGAHAGRGIRGRRCGLRALGQRCFHPGYDQVDGGKADHLRLGQSRPGNHRRGGGGGARRRHHGHRPLRLSQPGQ